MKMRVAAPLFAVLLLASCGSDTASEADLSTCELGDATDTIDTGDSCSREWICDDGTLSVSCTQTAAGFTCGCIDFDGLMEASFDIPTGACLSLLHDSVVEGCGWDIVH